MPRKPKEKPEGQSRLEDVNAPEDQGAETEAAEEPKPEQEPMMDVIDPIDVPDPEAFMEAARPDPPTIEEALKPIRGDIEFLEAAIGLLGKKIEARLSEPTAGPALAFSDKTDKLFPALLEFHKNCIGRVKKDSTNPYYSSNYASRGAVKAVIHEPLTEAGLFILGGREPLGYHTVEIYDEKKDVWHKVTVQRVGEITYLIHAASGQYVKSTMVMDSKNTGPQAMGTVDSYGARYNTIALCDLAAEDDDGEQAEGRAAPRTTAGQKAQGKGGRGKKTTPVSEAVRVARELLMKEIKDRIEEAGILGEVHPSQILKEVTSFPRKGKDDFPGYEDLEKITAKGMVDASLRRLQQEHPKLSDEALGRGA
jgi:hypothetical protein